jgi:hypothetical protein
MTGLPADPLLRAWFWLMAASAATTALTLATDGAPLAPWSAAALLGLAGAKAALILRRYLGLDAAPFWRRGFETALGGALLLFLALFLIPAAS